MADITKVRIGLESARELELEVEDATVVRSSVVDAIDAGDPVVWITDAKGKEYGLVTNKVAFIEIEMPESRANVGFAVTG